MSIDELKIEKGNILKEITLFYPSVNYDNRGTLFTTYNKETYCKYLPDGLEFIHDKFAESKKNVLRGLHGDGKTWKLISCIYGEIFEVVVDYRKESATYLQWESFELNNKNKKQILVPPGFLNGYCVLNDFGVFHYKLAYIGEYYDAGQQMTIKWDDPRLNIPWPVKNPILSERDK